MIRQEQIAEAIDSQMKLFLEKKTEVIREDLPNIPIIDNFATIITNIRRCGKSTILLQLLKQKYQNPLYFNFEDIRLAGFEVTDFSRLKNEIVRREIKVLFLDEIQLVEKWEIFVHQILNEGFAVFITGSNAKLLSKELGTHLTGRYVSMELFPFSYTEFLRYKQLTATAESLQNYLNIGGFPEQVKNESGIILNNLLNDILIRDIAVRHSVKALQSLRQLVVYLISNVGSLVSANKLTGMFGIKSSTILEYLNYLKDTYIVEFLPQFGYSLKAQARNPKKVYVIDTGIISEVSSAFTDNLGHKFENLIYLHLRRSSNELYFLNKKENVILWFSIKEKQKRRYRFAIQLIL